MEQSEHELTQAKTSVESADSFGQIAQAKGYGTDARLITISYLVCTKLKHLPT